MSERAKVTELSDVKAGLFYLVNVLHVLNEMAFDLRPVGGPPALCAQIDAMQAIFAMLLPFVKQLDEDLERFPDRLEPVDGGRS